ncbi:MAG: YggW family oxidoreductase [Moraxellaceae bacterium]|nr:YggW family oxidoreductase [Moraxellaceae bacterium]
MIALPPLSLYIHVPWCVRKCPYCDFNSHAAGAGLPEREYIAALLVDLEQDAALAQGRPIATIFIGGGTPSLFSAAAYEELFAGLRRHLVLAEDIEITLEANPGTVEQEKFRAYRALGINRLSIGVQSFAPEQLKALGRIHGRDEALRAAEAARAAGFDNFNIDLMHGLPGQSLDDALADIRQAIALAPTHLSWYQLTIEPNTAFYRDPPVLPEDDTLWAIQEEGQAVLAAAGYRQYEVSAYAQAGRECRHNRNYWEFGDYLALGAGAHGKITRHAGSNRGASTPDTQRRIDVAGSALLREGGVWRYAKTRQPRDYLAARETGRFSASTSFVETEALVFEFMLNTLRLRDGVPAALFAERTGLALTMVADTLAALRREGLLVDDDARLACTPAGFNYLNTVLQRFLA